MVSAITLAEILVHGDHPLTPITLRFLRVSTYSFLLTTLPIIAPALTAPAIAQAATDADSLMKKAASLEAAQQWEEAGEAYNKAATAYEAQGQAEEQTKALEKSASMYEKYADSLTNHTTPTHTTTPAPAPKPSTPTAEVHSTVETQAAVPLSKSQIVHTNKHGGLVVAAANGHVIDGVKVSIHDKDIESPSMVVAPNGTIHIAFREQAEQGSFCAIYHRSSSDGGKTWSTARNLSDSKPDLNVGRCQIAADGQGRVYVVWRYGFEQYDIPDLIPHAGTNNNLVYSVLTGSSWSKPISLHTPVTYTTQNTGSESFFMSTDPNGAVHVIWNQDPTILHPDLKLDDHHSYGVGVGMVMESKLDGASPSTPREIYLPPVSKPNDIPTCDGLDLLNGYVDGDGVAHFAALVQPTSVSATGNHFHVIDGENQSPSLDLPGSGGDYWVCQPTLLRDAQRRQHLITLYPAGELPGVRDYVVGNYDAPKVIRSI